MNEVWPKVRLRDVLRRSEETITPKGDAEYSEITVRLWGKGVVERGRVSGASIPGRRFITRTGQFIASRIDARNGAMGLVPSPLGGALVTNDFPLFSLHEKRLFPAFLGWLCKTKGFVELCQRASEGTTNRVRLKEERFLALEIPLPPLVEQRRIVARIEELAGQIHEALTLHQQAIEETAALVHASTEARFRELAAKHGVLPLSEVCLSVTDGDHNTPVFSENGIRFIFVGNVSSGYLHFDNTRRVEPNYYAALKSHRVPKCGDILFSAVGATLGIPAIVNSHESFCFQRHIAILKPDADRISSRFFWHMLRSRTVFEKAWASTTGSAQPTVSLREIRKLPIPVPSLSEQRRIVVELDALQAEIDVLKKLQAENAAELDALLPAILDRAFSGQL